MKNKWLTLFLCLVISICAILKCPSIVLAQDIDHEVQPLFIVESITAAAFVEFVVGMGISVGLTGMAIDLVRTDDPITSFDDLADRGVSSNVIDSLKSKYDEMVEHFNNVGTAFKLGAAWLKSLDLSSLASALGFKVATSTIVETGEIDMLSIPAIKDSGRKYYIVQRYKGQSDAFSFTCYFFDDVTRSGRYFYFTNGLDVSIEGGSLNGAYTVRGEATSSSFGFSNVVTKTNCSLIYDYHSDKIDNAAFDEFVISNGFLDGSYILNRKENVITGIDTSLSVPTSVPAGGISVTGDAIASYPIPQAGSAELDEDGKIVTGDLSSVIPSIKEYVESITLTGDLVISDSVDDSVDVPGDDAIPGEDDVVVPELGALGDYTVGLSDLFPFCLPFDLIDFISILARDPKAPYFEYDMALPSWINEGSYKFVIDLSPFDDAAKLLRTMETLLFIIGLIILTRDKMIRG